VIDEVFLARGCIRNLRYKLVVYYDLLHFIIQILCIRISIDILSGYSVLVQFLSPLLLHRGWMLRRLQTCEIDIHVLVGLTSLWLLPVGIATLK